jgi:excisionase family DNA binding protein
MREYEKKDLYRPQEVAKILRVSQNTVYRYINKGYLGSVRPPGKTLRISRAALEELVRFVSS